MTNRHTKQAVIALLLGSLILLTACRDKNTLVTDPITTSGDLVVDFSILDVNPNSATHDQPVSPRDYMQKVSAWYFGHAT